MTWHFWTAVISGLVAASLIDWLFAGVLFHDRYMRHAEVWRTPGSNPRAIIAAQLLTIPTVLGMLGLIELSGARAFGPAAFVAGLVWTVAAGPATIVNGIFIKIDPAVVAAHAAGWLIKLLAVASIAVALL